MDYISEVKKKYSYLSADDCEQFVNKAKAILVDQLYPADFSVSYTTYNPSPRFDMWILDCVDELIERQGVSSLTAYKENGVSFTWGKSGVSQGLLDRIPRFVGVVK